MNKVIIALIALSVCVLARKKLTLNVGCRFHMRYTARWESSGIVENSENYGEFRNGKPYYTFSYTFLKPTDAYSYTRCDISEGSHEECLYVQNGTIKNCQQNFYGFGYSMSEVQEFEYEEEPTTVKCPDGIHDCKKYLAYEEYSTSNLYYIVDSSNTLVASQRGGSLMNITYLSVDDVTMDKFAFKLCNGTMLSAPVDVCPPLPTAHVELELKQKIKIDDLNTADILATIGSLCNVKEDEIDVRYDLDENENVVHIVVYINDEEKAKNIVNVIESTKDSKSCDSGVICSIGGVKLIINGHSYSGAAVIYNIATISAVLLVALIMNFLF